jgi:CspA family cold shock protein
MHRGKIMEMVRGRSYGFIKDTDGTEVFFHESGLVGVEFDSLKEEQKVEFEIEDSPKGPRAFSISVSKE